MKHRQRSFFMSVLVALLLATVAASPTLAGSKPVDINAASVEQLVEINGIGNAKAQAIVSYRDKNGPFTSVDELRQVSGIGDKILERIRPQVTVGTSGPGSPGKR